MPELSACYGLAQLVPLTECTGRRVPLARAWPEMWCRVGVAANICLLLRARCCHLQCCRWWLLIARAFRMLVFLRNAALFGIVFVVPSDHLNFRSLSPRECRRVLDV